MTVHKFDAAMPGCLFDLVFVLDGLMAAEGAGKVLPALASLGGARRSTAP
ncbi:MAG: hypothetical protein ACKVSF_12355 [Alphaproteobacteria bacterium]